MLRLRRGKIREARRLWCTIGGADERRRELEVDMGRPKGADPGWTEPARRGRIPPIVKAGGDRAAPESATSMLRRGGGLASGAAVYGREMSEGPVYC